MEILATKHTSITSFKPVTCVNVYIQKCVAMNPAHVKASTHVKNKFLDIASYFSKNRALKVPAKTATPSKKIMNCK